MTSEVIDQDVFEELSDAMGDEFAAELVTTFLADAPNMFSDLKAAAASNDPDAFRRAAHSIKSNAQVFGATALAEQAKEMELAGSAESGVTVEALEETYQLTATALEGLLDG